MARGKGVLAPALGLLRYRTPQHCKALHSMLTPSSLCTPPSLAQFPDFHSLSIVSLVGAIMPLLYASVSFISILVKGPVANVSYEMISKVRKQPVLLGCLYVIVLCFVSKPPSPGPAAQLHVNFNKIKLPPLATGRGLAALAVPGACR